MDDVLAIGKPEVLDGFCARMAEEWEVGAPEWIENGGAPVKFFGMEIEKKLDTYYVHRKSYLADLLGRYPGEGGGSLGNIKVPHEEEDPSPQEVQKAQKETGELLWIAGRTRPDISYGVIRVSIMGQYAAKRPRGVQKIGKEPRQYLRETQDLMLEYALFKMAAKKELSGRRGMLI